MLGFAPAVLDNRVHKLTVRVKQPGMAARARKSYLAAAEKVSTSQKERAAASTEPFTRTSRQR